VYSGELGSRKYGRIPIVADSGVFCLKSAYYAIVILIYDERRNNHETVG
jgi:hypothetical protein